MPENSIVPPAASVEGTTPPSLRELAERAGSGTWRVTPNIDNRDEGPMVFAEGGDFIAECEVVYGTDNAAYIAAANPAAILELLAEVESLRSALREAQEAVENGTRKCLVRPACAYRAALDAAAGSATP